MITIRAGKLEIQFETYKYPQEGLFRYSKSGKGWIFLDIWKWRITLTNYARSKEYFDKKERNVDDDWEGLWEQTAGHGPAGTSPYS